MTISTKFELRQKVKITSGETGWVKAIFPDIRVLDAWHDDLKNAVKIFKVAENTTIRYWLSIDGGTTVAIAEESISEIIPFLYWDEKTKEYVNLAKINND